MKLSIQLHLVGSSFSNTVLFFEIFGVDRVRPTVQNRLHWTDLQPGSGRSSNHVAVDETVIQSDDERYWLYATVDLDSNDLHHTTLEQTRTNVIVDQSFAKSSQKCDVDNAISLAGGAVLLHRTYKNMVSIVDTNDIEIGPASDISVINYIVESSTSQTVSAELKQKLLTSGCDRSLSHGISVSEHDLENGRWINNRRPVTPRQ